MAGTRAIVGLIETVAAGDEAALSTAAAPRAGERRARDVMSVRFADGEVGLLDMSEPHAGLWASVLASLHEDKRPAYVEVDPRTRRITQLLQPRLVTVGEIVPLGKGPDLLVELIISHAEHILRRKHPGFEALSRLLHDARKKKTLLWVTETLDTHEIIDVRPAPREGAGAPGRRKGRRGR